MDLFPTPRPATDEQVGLEEREPLPPEDTSMPWHEPRAPFVETDTLFMTETPAAWGGGATGLVFAVDGERVKPTQECPFGTFRMNHDAAEYDGKLVFSTQDAGWAFELETRHGEYFVWGETSTEFLDSARLLADGRGLALMRGKNQLRLRRRKGDTLERLSEAKVYGDRLDLVLGGRAAVTHGVGGASLVTWIGDELRVLWSQMSKSLLLRQHDGAIGVETVDGKRFWAFTGVESLLNRLGVP